MAAAALDYDYQEAICEQLRKAPANSLGRKMPLEVFDGNG